MVLRDLYNRCISDNWVEVPNCQPIGGPTVQNLHAHELCLSIGGPIFQVCVCSNHEFVDFAGVGISGPR